MKKQRFDVLAIGNAIVDIIAEADDDFLAQNGIIKGAMNLIDMERAEKLYAAMGPAIEASGGSAANTAAGVASLGGASAYFGKVNSDDLGRIYAHDIRAGGVEFSTTPLSGSPPTARSMIFVTPDGERSMNTYLGACVELGPEDIDADTVAASAITYFEGYLWDPPRAKEAIRLAAEIAHKHKRSFSMTLSDPFCVDRYRGEFLDLIRTKTVDLVFANEAEIKSLYETSSFDAAVAELRADCEAAVVTRSEKGCVVLAHEETHAVPAWPVERIVDTTGAGDQFAAGFLYGITNGRSPVEAARIGGFAAAKVIEQIGPRVRGSLKQMIADAGF